MDIIEWDDFAKVDIRVGTIINAEPLPKARCPAFILRIDFGDEIGEKKSSAQITDLYEVNELIGKRVVAVVNFRPSKLGLLCLNV